MESVKLEMFPVVLILLFLVIAIYVYIQRLRKPPLPPGRLGIPLIGDNFNLLRSLKRNAPWDFYAEKKARYGSVFKMSVLGSTVVVLPTPAGSKFVFTNEEKLVVNSWPKGFKRLLGPASLTAQTGEDFRRLKRVLMAFLKPEALQRYVPKVSKLTLEHLRQEWDDKSPVLVYPTVKSFSFSIISCLLLSLYSKEEQLELEDPFVVWCKGLVQIPLAIPGTLFHEALKKREVIRHLLDKVIRRRKEELLHGTVSDVSDLLSVMLTSRDEDGQPSCSENEIKDNLLVLLFAGHDTASSTMTVAMKFLADHPEWKEKVFQENLAIKLQKVVETGNDNSYSLDWEDLKNMRITWRVLQETLRLQPPAPGAYRDVIKEFELGGYTIPKGWKVNWTVTTHREPEFFPNPDKFDPSRFEGEGPVPYTYVPFGGGPRMCPGNEFAKMEMLVFLHHLVVRYDWELVDPSEEIIMDPMPMPKHELLTKLHRRSF